MRHTEVKTLVLYTLLITLQSVIPVVTGSVRLSLLGTHIKEGTKAQVIYSTTNNVVIFLVYMLFFYTAGMTAQVVKNHALHVSTTLALFNPSKQHDIIGKRITISYLVGLVWSVFLISLLYGLMVKMY